MSHFQIEREYPWLYPISLFFIGTIFVLLTMVTLSAFFNKQSQKRLKALESHVFPKSYQTKVMKLYPHLSTQDVNLAFEQLRFYFFICLLKQPTSVAMPSRIVDVCWHIFLCDTRQYKQFCEMVFSENQDNKLMWFAWKATEKFSATCGGGLNTERNSEKMDYLNASKKNVAILQQAWSA